MLSEEERGRYARHFPLHGFGEAGQEKLKMGKVLVIGSGGLGSPVILYLAAAGVGTIGICDADTVSESNLQRQVIHRNDRLGMEKVLSAKRTVEELNPNVKVVMHPFFADEENIRDLLAPYDFIVDCTDRIEKKFMISDACVQAGKPFSHGGAVGYYGQVMTCIPGKTACLRSMLGSIPENSKTCEEVGILGALTGMVGSMQAAEAVKYFTGVGELLTDRMLYIDALTMEFTEVPML